ncbi:carbohydrate kinase family protein [Gleimia hominis]|uniref:Carbohydrate kinase family protein n=1 Tax=Gleimia hominis TaxID=595468 RepID=A0ABU3IA95_9ACTO|nr:carbohydrate kinase family protein [Gleimia hominis]MDT3767295.1 carbohydrate kinase family protein [Gleimia hominis]
MFSENDVREGASVLVLGTVFRDITLTGLNRLPVEGEEIYANAIGYSWGGIATMARVSARLRRRTFLCAPVGDDEVGAKLLADMQAENVDCSLCEPAKGWSIPTTVALSVAQDRAMVTVEEPPVHPIGFAPITAQAAGEHAIDHAIIDMQTQVPAWLAQQRESGGAQRGLRVYGSCGYDSSQRWDPQDLPALPNTDVWMLNELEAQKYGAVTDPEETARKLTRYVPVIVVTLGAEGMLAFDSRTGEYARVPAFPVKVANFTGAGDSTLAAFSYFDQFDVPLQQKLLGCAYLVSEILKHPQGAANPPDINELRKTANKYSDLQVKELIAKLL